MIAFALGNVLPRHARNAFRLAMLARLSISVLNIMMDGQMIGADVDANRMYGIALERSSNVEDLKWDIPSLLFQDINAFTNIHALIQWALGGDSFFLAHTFSLLGGAFCLILISKIWLLLMPTESTRLPYVLLIYSLLPSVLCNQSYILREVWQSLSILGIVWMCLNMQKYGYSLTRVLVALFFAMVGVVLHTGMIFINLVTLVAGLLIASKISLTRLFMKPSRLFKYALILILCLLIMMPVLIKSTHFQLILDGQIAERAESLSESGLNTARTWYGKQFYATRPWTIISAFAAYQIMPLPWQLGSIADLVLAVENMFRVFLLLSYLFYRKKLTQFHKDNMDVLFLIWFLIELVWSVGTVNWGTASRHHVPAVGLLVIVGLGSRYLVKPKIYMRAGFRQPNNLVTNE